ncbi:hypothetical protein KFE98_05315 [bacterium SCSIO 12741]|nr:hypothetical protein KFE98_05315 [bacterium SCSIO 12741]
MKNFILSTLFSILALGVFAQTEVTLENATECDYVIRLRAVPIGNCNGPSYVTTYSIPATQGVVATAPTGYEWVDGQISSFPICSTPVSLFIGTPSGVGSCASCTFGTQTYDSGYDGCCGANVKAKWSCNSSGGFIYIDFD